MSTGGRKASRQPLMETSRALGGRQKHSGWLRRPPLSELRADSSDEGHEITQTVLDDVLRNLEIHAAIPMNDDVSKAGHASHRRDQVGCQPSHLDQAIEQLAVCVRLAQTLVRDDVGSHVKGRVYGDLQRVQHEPGFPNVADDLRRTRQRPELLDARLDEREFLGEKVDVGQ